MPTKIAHEEKRTSSFVLYCGVFSLHFCVLLLFLFATPLSTTAGGAEQQAEGLLVRGLWGKFHYFCWNLQNLPAE